LTELFPRSNHSIAFFSGGLNGSRPTGVISDGFPLITFAWIGASRYSVATNSEAMPALVMVSRASRLPSR
jgi:hypothetical protein